MIRANLKKMGTSITTLPWASSQNFHLTRVFSLIGRNIDWRQGGGILSSHGSMRFFRNEWSARKPLPFWLHLIDQNSDSVGPNLKRNPAWLFLDIGLGGRTEELRWFWLGRSIARQGEKLMPVFHPGVREVVVNGEKVFCGKPWRELETIWGKNPFDANKKFGQGICQSIILTVLPM